MAAARRRNRRPQGPKIPQSAAEKEANVSLTLARQLGVAQNRAKQAASSRGAFRERKLRASGDMSRYNLARFKDDPFPTVNTGGNGGGAGNSAGPSGGSGARTSPRPKKVKKGRIGGQGGGQERGEIKPKGAKPKPKSTTSNPQNQDAAERKEAYLKEQARKKAEAAKKKLQGQENKPRSSGNTMKAL